MTGMLDAIRNPITLLAKQPSPTMDYIAKNPNIYSPLADTAWAERLLGAHILKENLTHELCDSLGVKKLPPIVGATTHSPACYPAGDIRRALAGEVKFPHMKPIPKEKHDIILLSTVIPSTKLLTLTVIDRADPATWEWTEKAETEFFLVEFSKYYYALPEENRVPIAKIKQWPIKRSSYILDPKGEYELAEQLEPLGDDEDE